MKRISKPSAFSEELVERIRGLGQRIRVARIRRKLRQSDLAAKTMLSKSTIEKIEHGELTTSIGAYAQALWVLNLDRELDLIADAGLDREGLAFSVGQKRVMPRRKIDNEF